MNLNLGVDMYGCPNRCKHCWLGHMPNKKMSDEDALFIVDKFKEYFPQITFYSWFREPDYCSDYEERWNKDIALSTGRKPERFELASFYQLVRDPSYVKFLKKVGVKKVQLTFFGLKKYTDYFVGRKGAFKELLKATEILVENGITPRWQAFINEKNKNDVVELLHQINQLKLKERYKDFNFFVHEGSCDGENKKLYDIRIQKSHIPNELIPYFLDFNERFPESECYRRLIDSKDHFVPHNDKDITLNISADFDVYFNFTAMTLAWKIGNLKKDNMKELVRRIKEEDIPALREAKRITVSELVKRYGNPRSDKVFTLEDYNYYLLNTHLEITIDSKENTGLVSKFDSSSFFSNGSLTDDEEEEEHLREEEEREQEEEEEEERLREEEDRRQQEEEEERRQQEEEEERRQQEEESD